MARNDSLDTLLDDSLTNIFFLSLYFVSDTDVGSRDATGSKWSKSSALMCWHSSGGGQDIEQVVAINQFF